MCTYFEKTKETIILMKNIHFQSADYTTNGFTLRFTEIFSKIHCGGEK